MSKELTEQWKNGELDVLFDVYVKIPDEGVRVRKIYYLNQYLGTKLSDEIEIFSPVPTYDHFVELTEKDNQFSQMVKKVKKLEKQLKEANNLLLGFLDENICSFDHNGYCQEHSSPEPDYRCIQQQLKWYFKKYEV